MGDLVEFDGGDVSQAELDAETAREYQLEARRVHRLVSLQFPRGVAQWLIAVAMVAAIMAATILLGQQASAPHAPPPTATPHAAASIVADIVTPQTRAACLPGTHHGRVLARSKLVLWDGARGHFERVSLVSCSDTEGAPQTSAYLWQPPRGHLAWPVPASVAHRFGHI